MPAPQAALMKQTAKALFMANALKVPKDWQQPSGEAGSQYSKAFKAGELATAPGAPPLFIPASVNKYHTETQKMLNDKFGGFIDGICDAICSAWSTWQSAATMVGIVINAVTATGGQVVGPPLTPLILAQGPKDTAMMAAYSASVATAVGTLFLSATAAIKVTGMPWYPAFAAFPSPVAPPTPNVPCPLIAIAASVPNILKKDALSGMMIGAHATAPYAKELFDAISGAIETAVPIWLSTTMVTNVLGTGPIPSFAPPYVPVGPVVAGVGTMTPGGFT